MTNPYLAADHESCIVDEIALHEFRVKVVEAIECAKKLLALEDLIGDRGFLSDTLHELDNVLEKIASTENAIQEGINKNERLLRYGRQ